MVVELVETTVVETTVVGTTGDVVSIPIAIGI
jgi:hypothetical protein